MSTFITTVSIFGFTDAPTNCLLEHIEQILRQADQEEQGKDC
jgi:hypothetical protein